MIQTQSLSFSYSPAARFTFPDLRCDKGESLLITGKSGTGKTTLLHLLGGLLRPSSGSVSIAGTALESLSERQLDAFRGRQIGMILQESHFVAALSVLENLQLASWLATGNQNSDRALQLLAELDLRDHAAKYTSQLSIGQKQRISIARALITSPSLVLADEPTSSLDDENAAIVTQLLKKLSQEYGAALIIVTHDQRLKEQFTNSVVL